MKVTLLNNADNSSLVASFITSVKGDLDSPVTSNFGNRVGEYRAQAQRIADEIDGDSADFERMRRIAKEIEETLGSISRLFQNFGHVSKEVCRLFRRFC
ncbi:hypothetical protein AB6A40_009289 [Gnathostoma spinigerum]|uniref:Uncharacterized protein n=1 Tax=Gnathostoma spinigerum TaxID=75299 RepID=A0ABD6ERJ4_9BILA